MFSRLMKGSAKRMPGARSVALALAALASAAGHAASAESERVDQLKAGYLMNFVKFVEWPVTAPADLLTICFVGGTGVQQSLPADLTSRRAAGRPLAVRAIGARDGLDGCGVLYVDSAALPLLATAPERAALRAPSMLTISDDENFIRQGGVIALFTESNRLRFSINFENARRAGLKISSSLLQLASRVDREAS